ncbi:MAG TPA: hypothetical protein VFH80_23510 [Solirubrobacteraceae bacterium]|nr:hypothetical protein [Solirubrobacteraceae bacterium]
MGHRAHTTAVSQEPSADRRQRTPDAASATLLRLQNTAGNTAVTQLIGQRRLSRRRQVPSDPTSLADYSALRGEITIDTATGNPVANKDLPGLFTAGGARFEPRASVDVSFHFSANVAKDGDKQALVQTGLSGIARARFNLASSSKDPVVKGATSILTLSLERFGGHDGRYRFTSLAGAKAGEIQVLIEYLGAAPTPLSSWDGIGKKGQERLNDRFTKFGFTWGDGDVAWSYDKKAQVMQALGLIPDAVLNEVSGITWERRRAQHGPDGEAGEYMPDRKILLYTSAFDDDWTVIELVAHELGHGLSQRPGERTHTAKAHENEPDYRHAAGPLAKAPTEYGRKAFAEDFAEGFALFIHEPDTLKLLRPELFEYFTKLDGGLPNPPG